MKFQARLCTGLQSGRWCWWWGGGGYVEHWCLIINHCFKFSNWCFNFWKEFFSLCKVIFFNCWPACNKLLSDLWAEKGRLHLPTFCGESCRLDSRLPGAQCHWQSQRVCVKLLKLWWKRVLIICWHLVIVWKRLRSWNTLLLSRWLTSKKNWKYFFTLLRNLGHLMW